MCTATLKASYNTISNGQQKPYSSTGSTQKWSRRKRRKLHCRYFYKKKNTIKSTILSCNHFFRFLYWSNFICQMPAKCSRSEI